MNLIHRLVNLLPKFNEWAQGEAMQVISQYRRENDTEKFHLMNIADQFLSSAVVSGASNILLALTIPYRPDYRSKGARVSTTESL
jgi:hypothetical protein